MKKKIFFKTNFCVMTMVTFILLTLNAFNAQAQIKRDAIKDVKLVEKFRIPIDKPLPDISQNYVRITKQPESIQLEIPRGGTSPNQTYTFTVTAVCAKPITYTWFYGEPIYDKGSSSVDKNGNVTHLPPQVIGYNYLPLPEFSVDPVFSGVRTNTLTITFKDGSDSYFGIFKCLVQGPYNSVFSKEAELSLRSKIY